MTEKIACIGVGNVGRAWAIVFARAGYAVSLYDSEAGAVDSALGFVDGSLADLEAAGLIEAAAPVKARLHPVASLEAAVDGAILAQESVYENRDLKRDVFTALDRAAAADVVLASSCSSIPGSEFLDGLEGRARCLIAHPINPPYLVPLVELVPTPWTAEATVERCADLMRAVGQVPIRLNKEIRGFVLNRLQMALLGEALRLVGEGYCSAEDADKTVKHGLGLRWSFMGPFETGHLNANGGFHDYMTKFAQPIRAMCDEIGIGYRWDDALLARIHAEMENTTKSEQVPARQAWRDRRLMALRHHFSETEK
jgi:3-hydroxyacyl-CoA dehydrogenase